jgi:hypothetical protein
MNYTESFDQFSSRIGPTDLALYAGAGLIIWILFKDKLSPVQSFLASLINKSKLAFDKGNKIPEVVLPETVKPIVVDNKNKEDSFFRLIVSWKQTRDLALLNGCDEAIKVADQMFPFLSPESCDKAKDITNESK